MRTLPIVAGASLVVLAAAGTVWMVDAGEGPSAAADSSAASGTTAPVRRGDLVESSTETGTLQYADARDLSTDLAGTVTWLPASGEEIEEGQVLYRVDTRPVARLDGAVPAWRDLGPTVDDGADVRQLEKALQRLGYGDEYDMEADGEWTWVTTQAVEEWQEDRGLEPTGELPLGTIVFTDGDVRVSSPLVEAGARVAPGTPVLDVTGVERRVSLSMETTERHLVPIGRTVDLDFPDGATARGEITDVEVVPAQDEQSDETLTVTIEPIGRRSERAVADQLDGASVVVTATDVRAQDVLIVPVTALVALAEGGYAVDVVTRDAARSVPVEVVAFADSEVAVTGSLAEGDQVVTP